MSRSAIERIAPFSMGISYSLPVRLSRTLSESVLSDTWPSLAGSVCVSAISAPRSRSSLTRYPHYAEQRRPGSAPALPAAAEDAAEPSDARVGGVLRRAPL